MKCWQWDDQKSISLTRYVVALAILASVVMTVCGPWLVRWLVDNHTLQHTGPMVESSLLVQTVQALRRISWCCTWAAVLCLPVGVWIYLPFLFLTVAAGFMALLVRVLKNAFEQAVRMKDELDYTI